MRRDSRARALEAQRRRVLEERNIELAACELAAERFDEPPLALDDALSNDLHIVFFIQ